MTHHAKALPATWAGKSLSSAPARKPFAALQSSAAVTLTVALRYLALKRESAPRAPRLTPQRPLLRVVT
jgi:hypothetical protein